MEASARGTPVCDEIFARSKPKHHVIICNYNWYDMIRSFSWIQHIQLPKLEGCATKTKTVTFMQNRVGLTTQLWGPVVVPEPVHPQCVELGGSRPWFSQPVSLVETSLAIPDFHHPNRGFSLLKTGIQIWILVIQQCQPWELGQNPWTGIYGYRGFVK